MRRSTAFRWRRCALRRWAPSAPAPLRLQAPPLPAPWKARPRLTSTALKPAMEALTLQLAQAPGLARTATHRPQQQRPGRRCRARLGRPSASRQALAESLSLAVAGTSPRWIRRLQRRQQRQQQQQQRRQQCRYSGRQNQLRLQSRQRLCRQRKAGAARRRSARRGAGQRAAPCRARTAPCRAPHPRCGGPKPGLLRRPGVLLAAPAAGTQSVRAARRAQHPAWSWQPQPSSRRVLGRRQRARLPWAAQYQMRRHPRSQLAWLRPPRRPASP